MKTILRFALSLAMGLAATCAMADEEPCNIVRVASLVMSVDESGSPNVPMTVEGHVLNLLIDTGGFQSMLSSAVVADLRLPKFPVIENNISMFGGVRVDQLTSANDIDFGGLKAPRMIFLVIPAQTLSPGVDGLLAPDIMRAYDVEFDFANAKFNMFLKDHCDANMAYWSKDDHAEIPFSYDEAGHIKFLVEVDGKSVRVALDTGSSRSWMSLEEARSLFDLKQNDPAMTPLEKTENGYSYKYPFKTMTFGGVNVSNPDLELISRKDSRMPGAPDLILGMGILRQLHMYIASKERKLYVTAASAH